LALKVRSRTVRDEIANKKARSDLSRKRRGKAKGKASNGGGGNTEGAESKRSKYCSSKSRRRVEIAQRYVSEMLTLNNRKFDVRSFVLVASSKPMLVYVYDQVYFRASLSNLTNTSTAKGQHVTNTHVQKKLLRDWEDHIWNPDRVTRYATEEGLGSDFLRVVQQRIKRSCQFLLDAATPSFRHTRHGQWRLYGFDFVIDKQMQPWLVDTNHFPGFDWTRTPWAKQYASEMLGSMWQLLLDVHLGRASRRATPREGEWELIFNKGK
jgi:tubulin monoglycylase TTLL3/8